MRGSDGHYNITTQRTEPAVFPRNWSIAAEQKEKTRRLLRLYRSESETDDRSRYIYIYIRIITNSINIYVQVYIGVHGYVLYYESVEGHNEDLYRNWIVFSIINENITIIICRKYTKWVDQLQNG